MDNQQNTNPNNNQSASNQKNEPDLLGNSQPSSNQPATPGSKPEISQTSASSNDTKSTITHDLQERKTSLDKKDKVYASLGYVSFLFIVPLIGRRQNPEVMFNAKQGMVLFMLEVVIWFLLFVFETLLISRISGIGVTVFYVIAGIFWLVPLIFSLMGIYYVFQNKHWVMPIVGKLAKKLKF